MQPEAVSTVFAWIGGVAPAFAQGVDLQIPIDTPSGIIATVNAQGEGGVLFTYMSVVFQWFGGIAGLVLLVAIIWYGFLLMFSPFEDKQKEAKQGIMAALAGFVFLMSIGLLLYTLNPNFFKGFGAECAGGDCGTVIGPAGTDGERPGKPPGGTPPPGDDAPPATGGAIAVCEPASPITRGNGESSGIRKDMTAATIASVKNKFGPYIKNAIKSIDGPNPGVTEDLVAAIIQQESHGERGLKSPKGALGLMQIMPRTAKVCGVTDLELLRTDDQTNISCGTEVLATFMRSAKTLRGTIAAYNGGYGAIATSRHCTDGACSTTQAWECLWNDKAHTKPNTGPNSFQETRDYVMNVQRALEICPGNAEDVCGGSVAQAPKPTETACSGGKIGAGGRCYMPPTITSGACSASHSARVLACDVPAATSLAQKLLDARQSQWKPYSPQSAEGMTVTQELQYLSSGSCPCTEVFNGTPDSVGGFRGPETDNSRIKTAVTNGGVRMLEGTLDIVQTSNGIVEIRTLGGGGGAGHRQYEAADIGVVNGWNVKQLVKDSLGVELGEGTSKPAPTDDATKQKSKKQLCDAAQWLLQRKNVRGLIIHSVAKSVAPCSTDDRIFREDTHYRHFHVKFSNADEDLAQRFSGTAPVTEEEMDLYEDE